MFKFLEKKKKKGRKNNMAKVEIINQEGKKIGEETLNSQVFDHKTDISLLHRVVRAFLANKRNTISHTKTRAERRGGGVKPWKQKGTGRARAGSSRSPIWRKGGIVFGPRKDRNYSIKVNKKERRKALFISLSEKVSSKSFQLLESLDLKEAKTKNAALVIKKLKLEDKKVLLVLPGKNETIDVSCRNLENVKACDVRALNCYTVLNANHCLFLKEAIPVFEDHFLSK